MPGTKTRTENIKSDYPRRNMSVLLDAKTYAEFQRICALRGQGMAETVRGLITGHVKKFRKNA